MQPVERPSASLLPRPVAALTYRGRVRQQRRERDSYTKDQWLALVWGIGEYYQHAHVVETLVWQYNAAHLRFESFSWLTGFALYDYLAAVIESPQCDSARKRRIAIETVTAQVRGQWPRPPARYFESPEGMLAVLRDNLPPTGGYPVAELLTRLSEAGRDTVWEVLAQVDICELTSDWLLLTVAEGKNPDYRRRACSALGASPYYRLPGYRPWALAMLEYAGQHADGATARQCMETAAQLRRSPERSARAERIVD